MTKEEEEEVSEEKPPHHLEYEPPRPRRRVAREATDLGFWGTLAVILLLISFFLFLVDRW